MIASSPPPSAPALLPPKTVLSVPELTLPSGSTDRLEWLSLLRSDQLKRWQSGQRLLVEDYLRQLPHLRTDLELAVDLIYGELLLREGQGETPQLEEYVQRFPDYEEPLRDLFQMHRLLESRSRLTTSDAGRTQTVKPELPPNTESGPSARTEAPAAPGLTWPTIRSDAAASARSALASGTTFVPGYEMLEELGKGGMGVVYKARQQSLNRLVALKMIRGGALAGRENLARFRTEAEALASLQHPNIVQIYEVGEWLGQPYLSLELVEGSSLDRLLKGEPQQPRPAAQLVETLARAVHAAHQHGIIHRDLKPGNILMASGGHEPPVASDPTGGSRPATGGSRHLLASFVPKIADFGLAKRLDAEPGQTHSGEIMGTSSYMAPEQAAGRVHQLGPHSDVYALGAILYEMLTGRPPFKGASLLETLEQVRSQEPVPPSSLQPRLPRDLETICLKCLAKEAGQRYASALDLADDLHRYLNQEPIRARPIPVWERGWKWAHRRPLAALLVLAGLGLGITMSLGGVSFALYADQAARLAARELHERQAFDLLRGEVQELLLQGQKAVAGNDWKEAELQLSKVLAKVGDEPQLLEEKGHAERLLAEARNRLAQQEAYQRSRKGYDAFQGCRNEALLSCSALAGQEAIANRQATRQAARNALAEFGLADGTRAVPLLNDAHFSEWEKQAIATDCYELLLTLAEAVGQPISAEENAADQARQALRILEQASRLRGRPTRACHLQRAALLARLHDETGARAERRRAEDAALQPVTASDHFVLGKFRLSGERGQPADLSQAIGHLRDAVREQPKHFWAHYFLAIAHLQSQPPHVQEAVDCLTTCTALQPDMVWTYLLRGYAWGQLGDFPAAEADFRKAQQLPLSDEARYILLVNRGATRFHRGDLASARADLEQAIQLRSGEFMAYVNLAQCHQKQKRLEEALQELNRAIQLQPRLASLYSSRARLHLERKDLAAALNDFEKAIQLEAGCGPLQADDYTEMGRILHHNGRLEEALRAYDSALQSVPDHPKAHRLRAQLLLEQHHYAEALVSLDACMKRGKPTADVHLTRGLVRAKLGDYPDAMDDYSRAVELQPDSKTYAQRGWAYLVSEAPKIALCDFQEAIRLDPENSDAYNGRGLAQVKLGLYHQAIGDAQEALRRDAKTSRTLYNAARIFAQAMPWVEFDPAFRTKQVRDMQKEQYQRGALDLLRQALEAQPAGQRGRFWQDMVQTDAELDPIRHTAGFAQLEEDVGKSR